MAVFTGQGEQIPLPELERYRDAEWALHDPAIQRTYQGQWVVAFERKIIASGTDAQAVAEQARQIAQGQVHRLVFCAPEDPGDWLTNSPDMGVDFNDA